MKKEKTSTMKIVSVTLITLVIALVVLIGGYYLIFNIIPNAKVDNALKKYCGTWELIDDNYYKMKTESKNDWAFDEFNSDNIVAKKEIVINKDNIEKQTGNWGCEFNDTKTGYAITNFDITTYECKDNYYLFINLDELINVNPDKKDWKNRKVCFEIKNNELIQRDCPLGQAPNVGVKYKLK